MRKFLPLVALATLVLSGCSSVNEVVFDQDGGCSGAVVAVNYGGFGDDVLSCVSIPGQTALAKDLFAAVGVSTEGTKAYGDQVVCRKNLGRLPPTPLPTWRSQQAIQSVWRFRLLETVLALQTRSQTRQGITCS